MASGVRHERCRRSQPESSAVLIACGSLVDMGPRGGVVFVFGILLWVLWAVEVAVVWAGSQIDVDDGLEGPWLRRDWVQAENGAKYMIRRRIWTSDTGQLDQGDIEGSGDLRTSPDLGHVDVLETVVTSKEMTPTIVPSSPSLSSSIIFDASDDASSSSTVPEQPASDGYESMIRSSMPYEGPSSSLEVQPPLPQSSEFAFVLSSFPIDYTLLTPTLSSPYPVDYSSIQLPEETAVALPNDTNSSAITIPSSVTIVPPTSLVTVHSLDVISTPTELSDDSEFVLGSTSIVRSTPTELGDDSELWVSSTSVVLPIIISPSFTTNQIDFVSTVIESTGTSQLSTMVSTTVSTTVPTTLTTATASTLSSSETMSTSQGITSAETLASESIEDGFTESLASLLSSPGTSADPSSTATESHRATHSHHVINPSLPWYASDPPVTRTRDWFLTTMSRWFVPRPTATPDWNIGPPVTTPWPTAMMQPHGSASNATPPSWQELNDKMKFWIKTVLRVHRFNQTDTEKLASHLAFVYEKAFAHQQAPRRGKRYSGRSMAVQVVNLSVDYKERLMSLVYTLSQEGKPVPAQLAVDAMELVNETDMSRLLGYQVVTKAEPYLKPAPAKSSVPLVWIVTGVLVGILVFVIVFLIIYCKCCRPKFAGASLRDSGSIHSYGRENRLKMFEGSPGTFGTLAEKSYKDVFTSPIHIPSASPEERAPHTSRPRPKKISEYYINQAFDPDRRHRISTVTNVTSENHAYVNDDPVPGEAPEALYDRLPPVQTHETDGPQPLPRKSLRPEAAAALDSGSDSDTSLRSTPSTASTGRAKGITSSPDSVTTSLISDEGSNPAASGNSGKTSTDEEIREAQKQLDCMKKRIGEILDDALAKAAPKKVYGSLRKKRVSPTSSDVRRSSSLRAPKRDQHHITTIEPQAERMATPAETPIKRDAPTQTPAESKPRVIWSICKTSEVAAQTSLSEGRNGRHVSGLSAGTDNKTHPPAATDIHKPTQTVINAIRGELQKFNAAHRTHQGESFA